MVHEQHRRGIIAFIRMRIVVARQTPKQVFKRNAGNRLLTGPYPVEDEAKADWQFALLSVAAYGRSNPKADPLPAGMRMIGTLKYIAGRRTLTPAKMPDVDDRLNKAGWHRWSEFPDQKLEQEMKCSHLRAEVWEHYERSAIAVAFGGTVFTSGKDWASNLRWFIPWHKDEYTEIVSRFGPDLVAELARRLQQHPRNITIYSTGHSLGGGLAQQFAYSMPKVPGVPRVSEVYAFDPSPVTGYFSVKRAIRESNRIGLKIARIYERGEVLAILRSFTSLLIKPSQQNPEIRGARFSLFYSVSPVRGHSIAELADRMQSVAHGGQG